MMIPSYAAAQSLEQTITNEGLLSFTVNYPNGWDVERNTITSSGWVASIYDSIVDWEIQVDISYYPNKGNISRHSDIIENTFLAYYYACNEFSFSKIPFEKLDESVQSVIYEQYKDARETTESVLELHKWWMLQSNSKLKDMFKDKPIFEMDYKEGFECANFVPVDFKITDVDGYDTFQYIYSWEQVFPDGRYFDNVNIETDIWIEGSNPYIINISGETTLENFEKHHFEYEEIVESVKIHSVDRFQNSFPDWIKIDAGFFSTYGISNDEFKSSLSYIVKEKIKDRLGHDFPKLTIATFPDWLRTPSGWYSQNEITEEEFIVIIQYLTENKFIQYDLNSSG